MAAQIFVRGLDNSGAIRWQYAPRDEASSFVDFSTDEVNPALEVTFSSANKLVFVASETHDAGRGEVILCYVGGIDLTPSTVDLSGMRPDDVRLVKITAKCDGQLSASAYVKVKKAGG